MRTMTPGGCSVTGNTVSEVSIYKRTYSAGIAWAGVSNVYSHNVVRNMPHNCILGAGNIAQSDVGGVNNTCVGPLPPPPGWGGRRC